MITRISRGALLPVVAAFAFHGSISLAQDLKPLVELTASDANERFEPTKQVVAVKRDGGVGVTISPGEEGYPGVSVGPAEGKTWDLSAFGHIEAKLTNMGTKPVTVTVRIDDNGPWQSNPWNAENVTLPVGETKSVKVIFGHSWGYKPAYKLKTAEVMKVLFFTGKISGAPVTFRIDSLVAGGQAGEKPAEKAKDPNNERIVPKDGILLGSGVQVDGEKQFTLREGATATADGSAITINLPAQKNPSASFKPAVGRWRLADYLQVEVELKNEGNKAVTPRVRVESNNGPTDWVSAKSPVAPGKTATIVVPFGGKVWNAAEEKTSGNRYSSDHTSGVGFSVPQGQGPAKLTVTSIKAGMPPAEPMPSWVGKSQPADAKGNWKMTFEENFDGDKIDEDKWNVHTENYWDKRTYFSRDNLIMGDGKVRLRYEKKTVTKNDAPDGETKDYVCGFLDTYGKFTQRYGYFECRLKVPTAPGLWPAFWTMPDRGADKGPQWVRASTEKGGMELDIFEHLTGWGPYRYNVAHHWDGYGDKHKVNGTSWAYYKPDAEGYITTGVLWLPGSTTYYANGEVVAKWDNERVGSVESYPIVYMVSGGWDNRPLDDAQLPAELVVDYVRIYQRADLASEVDGPKGTFKK